MFDVAIAGLGPAGRALASACANRGLLVLAIDARTPGARWAPTYGIWADQLGDLPADAVRARADRPALRAHGDHRIERPYVVLNNEALQEALPLDGVETRRARLTDRDLISLRREARVVVDARGARPAGIRPDDPAPAQTAFGLIVDEATAAPALAGADGVLMDWRPHWASDPTNPTGIPSFLYVFPLGNGEVLLEETCLAAAPGMSIDELATRLARRLAKLGVDAATATPLGREIVRIPMRGRGVKPAQDILAVGTAGRGGHLVTGYSLAHALRTAPRLADALAGGETPRQVDPATPADVLREAGLRAVLNLDARGTIALFEAFGRLQPHHQASYLDRDAPATKVAAAMWGMFTRLGARDKLRLFRATVGWG